LERKYIYDDKIGFVELVDHMGTDLTIVNAARVSFNKHKESMDTKDEKLISYLIDHKHTSTLEHNVVTFRVKVPLFVRSQHMRHRTAAYNEVSRRYTDENIQFYLPKHFRSQHKSNRQASNIEELINPEMNWCYKDPHETGKCGTAVESMNAFVGIAHRFYEELMSVGVCREQARMALPQNLYTEYYCTANLRNIMHFIELRTHEGAQWEIQQMANAMLEIVRELWPVTVQAFIENQKH
jgi:thymidylate synthase (FAD)